MIWKIGAVLFMFVPLLPAGYSNLIATSDGTSVYFSAKASLTSDHWYVVHASDSGPIVEPVNELLADVNGTGTVFASATYIERSCGFAGSTCFQAASCAASFAIHGPGIDISNSRRRTFIRLDRSGKLAWIDQIQDCGGFGPPLPPALHGLYDLSTFKQIATAGRLANQRYGRRVITDRGQALGFSGLQLEWVDGAGAHPIRHVAGAFEAVTDAQGNNVVYVEAPLGELHWTAGDDQDLGLTGSAPALTDDGRSLTFLAPDGSLEVYDPVTRVVRRIGSDTYTEFTLAGNAIFAVTTGSRLVRIDNATATVSEWVRPPLEIESADASYVPFQIMCPLVCYGYSPVIALAPGMIVVLRGRNLNQPGWRARVEAMDVPLQAISETVASFQLSSSLPSVPRFSNNTQTVDIYNPGNPAGFSLSVQLQDRVTACLGALHQDPSRLVSPADPAIPGEIVSVYLTGLHGVEPAPDGTPNPLVHLILVADAPQFADPGMADPLFFGLAPGLIGIQQLNLRINRPASRQSADLFSDMYSACPAPAVAP